MGRAIGRSGVSGGARGTDGQREPRSAGAPRARPVRVRACPCASVRSCVRAPVCPRVRCARRKGGPGADARVSAAGGGVPGPPLSGPLRSLGFAGGPCAGQQQRAPRGPPPGQPKGRAGAPLLLSRGALFCRPLFPSAVREQSASTVGFWEITDKCGLNGFGFCFFLKELANI